MFNRGVQKFRKLAKRKEAEKPPPITEVDKELLRIYTAWEGIKNAPSTETLLELLENQKKKYLYHLQKVQEERQVITFQAQCDLLDRQIGFIVNSTELKQQIEQKYQKKEKSAK